MAEKPKGGTETDSENSLDPLSTVFVNAICAVVVVYSSALCPTVCVCMCVKWGETGGVCAFWCTMCCAVVNCIKRSELNLCYGYFVHSSFLSFNCSRNILMVRLQLSDVKQKKAFKFTYLFKSGPLSLRHV